MDRALCFPVAVLAACFGEKFDYKKAFRLAVVTSS